MDKYVAALTGVAVILGLAGCAGRNAHTASRTASVPIATASNQAGVIPAGSTVEVRANEAIEADSAAEGRTYAAEVTRDIVGAKGNVLAPKGSPAQLVVLSVTDASRVKSGQIELGLRSMTVNGRTYLVESAGTSTGERGLGANRRTAEMVGGGAVLGTLIGSMAGGGKGAAIGALAGAAAGAAAQVMTRGKEVRVPVESVLTFRLEQPVQLQGSGG